MWFQTVSPHMCIINSVHISEVVIRYKGPSKYAIVAVVAGSDHIMEMATNEKDAIEVVECMWSRLV